MPARIVVLLVLLLVPFPASAHKASDSYLSLRLEGSMIRGQWDISLRDIENAVGLDANGDARIVWGEVRTRAAEIGSYALARLDLRADGSPCSGGAIRPRVDRHTDGAYLVLDLVFLCEAPDRELEVGYSLFAELDPQHRGLLRFESGGKTETAILGGGVPSERFEVGRPSWLRAFDGYAGEGVWHIWMGLDHILFLICLLLPTVIRAQEDGERWHVQLRHIAARVAKVVTAFTLAHSITLALAASGLVDLPSRWIESVIAGSVVVVGLRNLLPRAPAEGWTLAFGFGLVHGLGFASVLADLGLPASALVPALLGFNLGVEAGQLAIVAAFLPAAFALRDTALYRRAMLPVGSAAIAAVAGIWLVERSLVIDLVEFL